MTGKGKTHAWVDGIKLDRAAAPPPRTPKPLVNGWAKRRVQERLSRGLIGRRTDQKIYLSWRLLPSDPSDAAFNLYRVVADEKQRLNAKPITHTTDFTDAHAPVGKETSYIVSSLVDGKETDWSTLFTVPTRQEPSDYFSLPLQGDYTFQKVGIADLNGDGDYDYVIKQPNSNIDPYRFYWQPSPDTYTLEAYLHDGTFLWKKKLGWSIERGIWYSPYLVHDFDGDGKAEVVVKTGEGDPRSDDGRVLKGEEHLSIWDGMTGQEIHRVPWPSRQGFKGGYAYNYASRNQLGVAYLDGKTPCLIVARGTYTLMKAEAWQFHERKLEQLWKWDSNEERVGRYRGQGAHFMHCVDVDEDGRDEVILGSCVLDDNGQGLWSTGMGHPDHCYVGDIDPNRPGLEIYYGMESRQLKNGTCLVDARTGKILWGLKDRTYHVHSTGLCADLDPLNPGMECYSGEKEIPKGNPSRWLHTATGELLENELTWDRGLSPRAAYWDADLQREVIFRNRITKYHGEKYSTVIEGAQVAWADVFGDWREEIITSAPGELRIYSTAIPAQDRRVTLMNDPIYRRDVTHLAMGYPQVPTTSFVLASQSTKAAMQLRLSKVHLKPSETVHGDLVIVPNASADVSPAKPHFELQGIDATVTSLDTAYESPDKSPRKLSWRFTLKVNETAQPFTRRSGKLLATVSVGDTTLTAVASIDLEDSIMAGPRIEAESFANQSGGEVRIREDKIGHSQKSISHWDSNGHWIEWNYQLPQAGNYLLVIRYATPNETKRRITFNGVTHDIKLAGTGGFSSTTNDWRHAKLSDGSGKPLVFKLPAGNGIVRMTNTDGRGTNLDYLMLVNQ